ncbi:MAG: hypothetical protein DCC71_15390 [Proteobacteria bacterium]|nr:MAG: hypothetical protein DCC71_15390 [Pseudomonadota bacterium]
MTFPKHTFELTLHVGACDWPSVVREVQRLAEHVEEHGPDCNMSSGGYGVGSYVSVEHQPDVTLESFVEAVEQWRLSQRDELDR